MHRVFAETALDLRYLVEIAPVTAAEGGQPRLRVTIDEGFGICPVTVEGRAAGYLVGRAVDIDRGAMVEGVLEAEPPREPGAGQAALAEAIIARLNGSFLLLLETDGEICAYTDAAATIGLVYAPDLGKAGSSAQVVLGAEYDSRLQPERVRAVGADANGWFPAGLTAHRGLHRLLPNHRLNLKTWQAERFWPVRMPRYREDFEAALLELGREIDAVIGVFARHWPITQCLTGGQETRALLACNRSARDHEFITLSLPVTTLDVHLSARLAEAKGLKHRLLRGVRATPEQVEAWRRAAGYAVAEVNATWYPTIAPLAGRVLVGGVAGEVGRAFLWPQGLEADRVIDPSLLLELLKLPQDAGLKAAVDAWLRSLPPGLDAYQTLDLAYLELRVGSWAFGQPRLSGGPFDISPLIGRRQFERMWSIPPARRQARSFLLRLVELFDAPLLDIPINRYGDWRDRLVPVQRAMRRPDRALRKLRQLILTR